MQAFRLRYEGCEKQAAFTTNLAPPGNLPTSLNTCSPPGDKGSGGGVKVREGVGIRNGSLDKLHVGWHLLSCCSAPTLNSMFLFFSKFGCISMVSASNP